MTDIVSVLTNPKSYDEPVKKIRMIQTHISWIFLTGKYAYKVKKPVNFGFCNFSTLSRRKFFCNKELETNKQFSDIYLEVVPINQSGNIIEIKGKGTPIEYAVKMKELPQDRIMSKLLEENKINKQIIIDIAKIVSKFHLRLKQDSKTKKYGLLNTIRYNFNENFRQTEEFIGITIEKEKHGFIKRKILDFIKDNKRLFERRVLHKKIKNCHGDLHSGNMFVTDKIHIFDAIEFNDRLRCGDVAKDIAFFMMDMDFHGRSDFSEIFLEKYISYTNDMEMLKLLPFYKCYYAFVRGKVISMKLLDRKIDEKEKKKSISAARGYFDLAFEYSKRL